MKQGEVNYWQEIADVHFAEAGSLRTRYTELYRIFNEILNEQTREGGMSFAGPFARMDFICKRKEASTEMYRDINRFRARCRPAVVCHSAAASTTYAACSRNNIIDLYFRLRLGKSAVAEKHIADINCHAYYRCYCGVYQISPSFHNELLARLQ